MDIDPDEEYETYYFVIDAIKIITVVVVFIAMLVFA